MNPPLGTAQEGVYDDLDGRLFLRLVRFRTKKGVVVPQMSYLVYMAFLAALGALLVVPGIVRRAART